MPQPSPTGQALLAAVHADRSDLTVRLVYADWLQENDVTELAEYIRLECEWLSRPFGDAAFPKLAREAAKLCMKEPLGGWEYAEELKRIRGKMDSLWAANHNLWASYATTHKDQTSPPIPEPDLLHFEAKLGFPLPTDYRAFLLRVANGGMGIESGLVPLSLDGDGDLSRLQRPFPFTRELLATGETGFDFLDNHEQVRDGWVVLGYIYAGFAGLVINGDLRGCVMGSDGWAYFVEEPPTGITFLGYYENWINDHLRECIRND